jgi:hypothetical protein
LCKKRLLSFFEGPRQWAFFNFYLGVFKLPLPRNTKHPKTQQATKQQEQGTRNIRANLKNKMPLPRSPRGKGPPKTKSVMPPL